MPRLHYSLWLAPLAIALTLFVVSRLIGAQALAGIYREKFPETRRERLFWASLGFFVAVAVVRMLTFLIHNEIGRFHDIEMRGRHIHHLVWGILLLLATGYGWLLEVGTGARGSRTWAGRTISMAYGVGAALTLDEFALWLNLRDVYWEREGRSSLEALALFGAALAIAAAGGPFLHAVARKWFHKPISAARRS
ncbi:MAG: hypothetical protein ACLQVN_06815 [Bryobacteraceae bacterium]